MTITIPPQSSKVWWKSAVVYQIYPSSFYDSNGDGIGDLPGIIAKLDYLKHLGIDALWLSPIFDSPQVDRGYDVSDYTKIYPPYGTVSDVEELIAQLHRRGMKLLLDLVVNHTSDEHPWFVESRSSAGSPKRDWYIWRKARYDGQGNRLPPNNWKASLGGGSVWEWDEASQEYYLHYYDTKMPDLNFDCPALRQAVYDVMRFWLDKGCDGYRMDVIGRISKDHRFPDTPIVDRSAKWQPMPRHLEGPRIHEFLREMNDEVLSKYDCMSVGELNFTTPDQMLRYVDPERREINMGFSFDHVNLGLDLTGGDQAIVGDWTFEQFKDSIARWQALQKRGGWHASYFENHDQPRSISRYAHDSPQWREASGKMLAMLNLTLWGTVFLHQGQEIGMINLPTDWPLEYWADVKTKNVVNNIRARGIDVDAQTIKVFEKARDNGRSPMQWTAESHGGFTNGTPWMRANDDYRICNAKAQVSDPSSIWHFYKTMILMRKEQEDIWVYGSFEYLSHGHPTIFAYLRAGNRLVVLNFAETEATFEPPAHISSLKLLCGTSSQVPTGQGERPIAMRPYEGRIYAV